MYRYLQYRADKKEKWHLVDEKQIATLPQPPAFLSVLSVDHDVDALEDQGVETIEKIKYRGPMYFDLDCEEDLDAVLESSRELIDKLVTKFDIETEYIHCWLSGGKGVHITIPETVFGLNRATAYLPMIYKQIAKEVQVDYLDMSVYSCGKGRLWRCEEVARPGSGTFKVGVTVQELEGMDKDGYEVLVASARPPIQRSLPPKNVSFAKAEAAFKRARQSARGIVKSIKNAKVIPNEEVRKLQETPGCIEKLIKEGDCPESTWNQAAMQVAAWVAARYDKEEEDRYHSEVIEPFVANVQSSTRPSEQERRKHLKEQLGRAFSGKTKFQVGPLISTLGEACHACPLCRGDLDVESYSKSGETGEEEYYDADTKIKATERGYIRVREDGPGQTLTNFTFWPEYEVKELEEDASGSLSESPRVAMVGTLMDDANHKFYDVKIPESAWSSRSALVSAVSGKGHCKVFCTDGDVAKISVSVLRFAARGDNNGEDSMTHTRICGVHMERTRKNNLMPAYIESGSSIYAGNGENGQKVYPARFRFSGDRSLSPRLIDEDYPYVDDKKLEEALDCLLSINDESAVARMVGWVAACHLREHIHTVIPQFPLLNVWGNAGAGKTMTALLVCHLNGMDYQTSADPLNMENATPHPLRDFVTSSTTVPRLVEEVNESLMGRNLYRSTVGIFKAAWNRSTAPRGKWGNGGAETDSRRVSSPIIYVSEQRTTRASLRNRTVEVMLTSQGRETGDRAKMFKRAYTLRYHLFRAAKSMLHRALTLSPEEVSDLMDENDHLVPESMDERPRFSMLVAMLGLDFMADSLAASDVHIREKTDQLKKSLSDYLNSNFERLEADKRTSEVDHVLSALDQMAADPTDRVSGLRAGEHYKRVGSQLSLNLAMIMSRYRKWCKALGEFSQINDLSSLAELISGESYFDRRESDPEKPGVIWHVINVDKLAAKGTQLAHFEETTDDL